MKSVLFDPSRRKLLLASGVALLPLGLLSCGGGSGGGGSGGGSSVSSSSSSSSSSSASLSPSTMTHGLPIAIDQFGYRPGQKKIAIIRDPQVGFDETDSFTPGTVYDVVNSANGSIAMTGTPTVWNGGSTDKSSGDKVWHFDFSGVTTAGDYFIRDSQQNVKSYTFKIASDVYAPVLRAAVRMLYYQRGSTDKPAAYAGASWADSLSNSGPLQDKNARLYTSPGDASTERDLSGGWYDAGDMNRYSGWTAGYIINLLHTYLENPGIWGEDYGIPESGNGLPDLLDEIKWGLEWLKKLQNPNGSLLSILSPSPASPPSAATGQSLYYPENTAGTRFSAGAFALGAKVFGGIASQASYAADLSTRAERAWSWCEANPTVVLPAGTAQETDDYGRFSAALEAAIYLFDATGKDKYRTWVDANYQTSHMFAYSNFVYPFESILQGAMLYYASLTQATAATSTAIKNAYITGMEGAENWGAVTNFTDPYKAFLGSYTWGSNGIKAAQGDMFAAMSYYNIGTHSATEAMDAASHYIHYLHGVNPLTKVYISNMAALGAQNSVNRIWHTWFSYDSAKWSSVKDSTYGPAPGYLVGGPEETYTWASGCPTLNAACGSAPPSPPAGQPQQKSYKDFNDPWPLDSWEVSEPSCGYQTAYIRLLAKFV